MIDEKVATKSEGPKGLPAEYKGNKTCELVCKWLMFSTCILGLGLLAAYFPVAGNIPIIVIPSILVLIFSKPVMFERLKLTTLVTMRVLIVFAAYRLFNPQIYVDIILLMLIINILEATFTDFIKHKQILNGISGLALAAGVVALKGAWQYDAPFGNYYLVTGCTVAVTVMYVIAYTLWNWIFVSYEFSPSVTLMHVGFLGTPIIGSLITLVAGPFGGFGMWLLLRANTLSIGGWLQIANKSFFEEEFYSEKFEKFIEFTHKKSLQVIFMIINIALIVAAIVISAKSGAIGYELPPFEAPIK